MAPPARCCGATDGRVPQGAIVPHETNRGVALYGDKVYLRRRRSDLVALDAKTGKEVWTATVADNKSGYYITLAPLIANGKVLVGLPAANTESAASSRRSIPRPAKSCGARSPFPRRANPAARPGRRAATNGRPAARRCGSPATTIRRRTWRFWVPATAARGWATSVPATISTLRRPSRSTSRPARSRAISNTIRTTRGTRTKYRRRFWSTTNATAAPSKG